MTRFDRYVLCRLLTLFGFFALVLVGIYWVNRAVNLFDRLIAGGHSSWVFLEFTLLTLPNVTRLVLPVAAFAAALTVANRLRADSELVVMQSTGQSLARLARPAAFFGLVAAAFVSLLVHGLVPASAARLADRSGEIARNITAGLLTEGVFLDPSDGITVYIREITPDGELRDLFLADDRAARQRTDYTAARARIVDEGGSPKLVMFDGMVQTLERADQRLSVTRFEDFAYDLGALVDLPGLGRLDPDTVSTPALLSASPALQAATGEPGPTLVFEAHYRMAQAAFAFAASLAGFVIVTAGRFSRFGTGHRVVAAVVLLVAIDAARSAVFDVAQGAPGLWPLAYAAPALTLAVAAAVLWHDAQPARPGRDTRPAGGDRAPA